MAKSPYRDPAAWDPGPGVDDSSDNMYAASYWWWRAYVRHFHWPVASMHRSSDRFATWYSARWAAFHAGTGPRPRHLDVEGWNYHYYVTRHGGRVPDGYLDDDNGRMAWNLALWHRTTRSHIEKLIVDGSRQLAAVDALDWHYRVHLIPGGPHGNFLLTWRGRPEGGSEVDRLSFDDAGGHVVGQSDLGVALDYIREAVRGTGS